MTRKKMAKKKSPARKAPAKKAAKKAVAKIDVSIASKAWPRNAAALCRRAAQAALDACALRKDVVVSILLTTDTAVRELNATYRGKNKPTNVLSFPATAEDTPPGESQMLGDVAVAYGVCAKEARAEDKAFSAHLSHLVVHGVLHLLGYDHERESEAEIMERWERKILARMGMSDPYADTVPETQPRKKARLAPKPRRKIQKKTRSAR